MIKALTYKFKRDQRGITGLETAIILIAFVVVAAIFAYTVLSAGLFSSQKSKEAIYSGLQEAQSTTELKGAVVAKAAHAGAAGYISQLSFTLSNAMGGASLDFTPPSPGGGNDGLPAAGSDNKVVISYTDQYQRVNDIYWTLTKLGKTSADNLLDAGEKFQITIGANISGADGGVDGGNLEDVLTTPLAKDTSFTVEVQTPSGAVLTFQRTTPAIIDTVMNLN